MMFRRLGVLNNFQLTVFLIYDGFIEMKPQCKLRRSVLSHIAQLSSNFPPIHNFDDFYLSLFLSVNA